MGRVVVGVDGSEGSRRALAWALEEAACHDHEVVAVSAVQVATSAMVVAMEVIPVPDQTWEQARDEAGQALRETIEEVAGPSPEVTVRPEVVGGAPARALMQAAEGADLLVVGSRGLGGFRGLLLGSVGHQVVTHAPCPVVVVPAPAD